MYVISYFGEVILCMLSQVGLINSLNGPLEEERRDGRCQSFVPQGAEDFFFNFLGECREEEGKSEPTYGWNRLVACAL